MSRSYLVTSALVLWAVGCSTDPAERPIGDPDDALREATQWIVAGDVKAGAQRVERIYEWVRSTGTQPDDPEVLAALQRQLLALDGQAISPMMIVNTTLALAAQSGADRARSAPAAWVEQHPDAYPPLLALAHLSNVLGARPETELAFKRAAAAAPRPREALIALGSLYADGGRFDEALAAFDRLIEIDPGDARAGLYRGVVLHKLGRTDEALEEWRRAAVTGEGPIACKAANHRGTILLERGDHRGALAAFQRAVEVQESDPAAQFNLGQALHALNRSAEARSCYERCLELRSEDARPHFYIGEIEEDAGRTDEAVRRYRRALELDPSHAAARHRLNLLLQRTGK